MASLLNILNVQWNALKIFKGMKNKRKKKTARIKPLMLKVKAVGRFTRAIPRGVHKNNLNNVKNKLLR